MYIDCMIWYREKHREILILSIILEKICFSHQPQGGTVQPSYTTRLQSPHVKELYEAFLWLWMDVKAVNLWSIDYFRTLTFLFLSFFLFWNARWFCPLTLHLFPVKSEFICFHHTRLHYMSPTHRYPTRQWQKKKSFLRYFQVFSGVLEFLIFWWTIKKVIDGPFCTLGVLCY